MLVIFVEKCSALQETSKGISKIMTNPKMKSKEIINVIDVENFSQGQTVSKSTSEMFMKDKEIINVTIVRNALLIHKLSKIITELSMRL